MRLIGISMVKNEKDIIEAYVRHNLRYLDALFILENNSTDGTRDILSSLLQEQAPIGVFDDPHFAFTKSQRITKLCHNVCRFFDVDFVFVLDADEFIRVESRAALEASLSKLPTGTCGLVPWTSYVIQPDDDLTVLNPILRIQHRRRREVSQFYKVAIPREILKTESYTISQGNHWISQLDDSMFCYSVIPGVNIAHYPVRDPEQITAKILNGSLAYLALEETRKKKSLGYHWSKVYKKLMENPTLTMAELSGISFNYLDKECIFTDTSNIVENCIFDPLETDYNLIYSDMERPHLAISIIKNVEVYFRSRYKSISLPVFDLQPQSDSRNPPSSASGASTEQTHQRNLFLDSPPFRYLFDRYVPESVLDVGCGLGGYLSLFSQWGAKDIFGIDGFDPQKMFIPQRSYLRHDLSEQIDLNRQFDLVVCTEVIEHISSMYEDVLLNTIDRHASTLILFSAAEPNQPGIGHINCQPLTHWLECWDRLGWVPLVFESLVFRSLASLLWLRRNPILLVRQEYLQLFQADPWTVDDLTRIAQKNMCWDHQLPKIYTYPLSEPLPDPAYDGALP